MRKILNTTNIWFFISLFILVNIIVLSITTYDKNNRIKSHLNNTTQTFETQYNTVYNSYMNISKSIHAIFFDAPIITRILEESLSSDPKQVDISRKKLYQLLKNKYKKLKKLGLEQLHFHTTDSKSFLRMHMPNKYGDDLSEIRYSVTYVNKNKEFIHGLEAGRVVHGFRFVYPMFSRDNKIHLGSVEVSISSKAFIDALEQSFDNDVHFMAKKEIIYKKLFRSYKEKYVESLENHDYLALNEEDTHQGKAHHLSKDILQKELGKEIDKNLKTERCFSVYAQNNDNITVATFIPLRNIKEKKVVAYLVSYSNNESIKKIIDDFAQINMLFIFINFLILYFIYLLNKNKQKLLDEQKKLAQNAKLESMREMIKNIAHHWRQPLSVISTAASGLHLQHNLNILKDDILDKTLDNIILTTKNLSNTIDDFRDFMLSENEVRTFKIEEMINKTLTLAQPMISDNSIKIIKKIETNTKVTLTEDILIQSIIKIINNSVDILQKIEDKHKRFIFINVKEINNILVISIRDNGGGIPVDIIDNIFEPYFTTKHQASGTGLGLYTVQSNINNVLKGTIEVQNDEVLIENTTYKGAHFTIKIPISHL